LGSCMDAGWEPTAATCPRCGEAVLDEAGRKPAKVHHCWSCGWEVATPHRAVVNPLADLLPRRKLLGSSWGVALGLEGVGFIGAASEGASAAATAATSAVERGQAATRDTCKTCSLAIQDRGVTCQGCAGKHHDTCARPEAERKLPFTCHACLEAATTLHLRDVTLDQALLKFVILGE
jgi:predicted RNA-binding Zn-ribbon protein involved in translation (DUF1610 family)